jgi:hypothetical protein
VDPVLPDVVVPAPLVVPVPLPVVELEPPAPVVPEPVEPEPAAPPPVESSPPHANKTRGEARSATESQWK